MIYYFTNRTNKKTETIKDKLKAIESKKDQYLGKGVKKQFMPKLLEKLKDRKGKYEFTNTMFDIANNRTQKNNNQNTI